MNFTRSESQQQLTDAVARLLATNYDFAERRTQLQLPADQLPPIWTLLVQLGLPGLLQTQDAGGFGGTSAELYFVQQQFGRALVVAPWLDTLLCSEAVAAAGSPAQRATLLPGVITGHAVLAWADEDLDRADGEGPLVTRAVDHGGEWRLDGAKACVSHGSACTHYLVSASTAAGARGLFLVERGARGMRQDPHRLADGAWAVDLVFTNTSAQPLAGMPLDGHEEAHVRMRQLAIVAACADAVGGAEAALELTVQHLRTRRQFGAPLAGYQVLRHRIAEMYILLEQARSMGLLAACSDAVQDIQDRSRQLAQAKLVTLRSAKWITQQAIQLHGGMGMSNESPIGHYYRRVLVLDARHGNERQQLAFLAASAA